MYTPCHKNMYLCHRSVIFYLIVCVSLTFYLCVGVLCDLSLVSSLLSDIYMMRFFNMHQLYSNSPDDDI